MPIEKIPEYITQMEKTLDSLSNQIREQLSKLRKTSDIMAELDETKRINKILKTELSEANHNILILEDELDGYRRNSRHDKSPHE